VINFIKDSLTFDDVLIRPKLSRVYSRQSVNTRTRLVADVWLEIPLISANMDTVTEYNMAKSMAELGGVGFVHRFLSWEKQLETLRVISGTRVLVIGVKPEDLTKVSDSLCHGINVVLIDVAHGHSTRVVQLIKYLKKAHKELLVIAGNVATFEGAYALLEAGADSIKVGVGPGAMCTTRIVTGCGVPQLTAILEAKNAIDEWVEDSGCAIRPTLIADGGIRNSGDVVKALAAGADSVMIGSLLSGTDEAPGREVDGMFEYRGMASKEAQATIGVNRAAEGVTTLVKPKGPVKGVVQELVEGIRSGLSYCGASSIEELHNSTIEMMIVTSASQQESRPHGVK
jgi:IMP dehydrogenase